MRSAEVALLDSSSFAALSLNFLAMDANTLDPHITFTRGSSGTFVGSNGLIQTALTNIPRFNYDPGTLAAKGLLIEEQRTNLLLNSLIDGTNLATQSVTVTAQAYTLSFYGSGTVTLSGTSTAGPSVGAGAYPARQTLTFTPTAGTLTLTVTGTVQFANLEAGSFATSFIPTAAAAVTRSADIASMSASNFSSWFNPSAGTFILEGDQNSTLGTDTYFITTHIDNSNNSFTQYYINNGGASLQFTGFSTSGVLQQDLSGVLPTIAEGVTVKGAFAYAVNDFSVVCNGGTPVTSSSGSLPAPTMLQIGNRRGNSKWLNGHIRRLTYYSRRLPDATLRSLTT